MKRHRQGLGLVYVIGLAILLGATSGVGAQTSTPTFFGRKSPTGKEMATRSATAHPTGMLNCKGRITSVVDIANEAFLFTTFNFNPANGGGEGGCFDPTPVLSTTVTIPKDATCLNAHFSAIVGNQQANGPDDLAPLAVFQVTLTRLKGGAPQHMVGHFETPFSIPCPAIAIEAERDVDTFGSNFFQGVGVLPGEVPPGDYRVDVWWAGAPGGTGGAFAGAFVLKLYGM